MMYRSFVIEALTMRYCRNFLLHIVPTSVGLQQHWHVYLINRSFQAGSQE